MDWERLPVAPLYSNFRAYCSHVKMFCKRARLLSSHPRLFISLFIFMEIFFNYFNNPLTQSLRKHFIGKPAPTVDIFRGFFTILSIDPLFFFSVILASVHEIPYCFNFLSMTIWVFLLLNANKCSCYSVKCSALNDSFVLMSPGSSNME